MLDPTVSDLARAADAIDVAMRHLARAERRGTATAASVAGFARLELERTNHRLMDCCDEIASAKNERAA